MEQPELLPHLFRTEYRKIVAVLCKSFGFQYLQQAEDIASETFLAAAETWGLKGLPQNPTAWLYNVARNRSINFLKRNALFRDKIAPGFGRSLQTVQEEATIDLSDQHINDSQLQMMFAICHPAIPAEAQVGLSLRLLCGFGITEIADAFLSNKETVSKRLARARERLREENIRIEMPAPAEIPERIERVLTTIYLVFSEGYYSASQNNVLRKDLCLEAMRLNLMLLDNNTTNTAAANALLSLMCFHASRFEARTNAAGEAILYDQQDRSLWNIELIENGEYYLNLSATGNELSKYHLEAAIAYWHTRPIDTREKWEEILQLYNQLLQVQYSPMAALNRTWALSKANSVQEAIAEAEKLKLDNNHFYFTLLGALYSSADPEKAKEYFLTAISLARNENDKQLIRQKISSLKI